jgi:hypothetical protein
MACGRVPARLAQTPPGVLGVLLLFSAVPAGCFGSWPAAEEPARTVDGAVVERSLAFLDRLG